MAASVSRRTSPAKVSISRQWHFMEYAGDYAQKTFSRQIFHGGNTREAASLPAQDQKKADQK
jgi:hypothetical protein